MILPFPYADVSGTKIRPAVIVSSWPNRIDFDYLLCLISSKSKEYALNVRIEAQDFVAGSLPLTSYIRPWYLFTAQESVIKRCAGKLSAEKLHEVLQGIQTRTS